MKIVIAPDSFKGSLEAKSICEIGKKVAKEVFNRCEVVCLPMADGGEGTVECICQTIDTMRVKCTVKNPLGKDVIANYCRFEDNAIMEMAQASGITLVAQDEINILRHSTYGTGQMILDAIEKGSKKIYIGIGGSATNDGGIGFASALGVKFLDENTNELEAVPENMIKIKSIDMTEFKREVLDVQIIVMCDVTNPLLGENGATNVFGKQKGANEMQRVFLEQGLRNYIEVVEKTLNKSVRNNSGAGAAGGLGAALNAFTNAQMQSGVDTILEILQFRDKMYDADLVVTGEGMIDYQSAFGKVVSGVGKICKEENVNCIAIVGGMGEKAEQMFDYGIKSIIPTVNAIMSLDDAIENAELLCESAMQRAFRLIKAGMEIYD